MSRPSSRRVAPITCINRVASYSVIMLTSLVYTEHQHSLFEELPTVKVLIMLVGGTTNTRTIALLR
jgi:hypothetical protein